MVNSNSGLAKGWAFAAFNLLFDNVTSSKLKLPQKQYKRTGKYPVIDQGQDLIGGYTNDDALLHPCKPPLLVFGDHTRCVKLADFQFVQGADGVKVLLPSHHMDPLYCFYLLKTAELPDKGYSRHFKFLRECIFRVPSSNEQKRIVARIEQLQEHSRQASEALEAIPELIEQLRQSVLAAAFRGGLTKAWREQNPDVEPASELLKRIRVERRRRWEEAEFEKLKAQGLTGEKLESQFTKRKKAYKEPGPVDTADFPELPDKWCWASFEELSWNSSYGTSMKCDHDAAGVPVLRIPNIDAGMINQDDLKYSLSDLPLRDGDYLAPRDFLIIRTNGSRKLVGRGALITSSFTEPTFFASYLIRFRFVKDSNVCQWVSSIWHSPAIRNTIEDLASTSAGQYNVNLTKLNSTILPIPPKAEIREINSLLENALEEEVDPSTLLRNCLEEMRKLERSILTRAFRGELVPQDPNDEPASELLERIEKERKSMVGKKRTHKKGPAGRSTIKTPDKEAVLEG